MGTLAIVNIGTLFSGELGRGLLDADTLLCRDGVIAAIGTRRTVDPGQADVVVDARGTTVAPGLIDSHCHVVLGDYTPRQKTVDFLDSYVHGGITSVISPGEIHAPGRPRDAAGVKALAVAARACFLNFRPTGMKVHAGAIVIEPTLSEADFREVAAAGVWLAKFGFGAFADPADGEPQVRWAQRYGLVVMCHSGGASIPGSSPITAEHLLRLRPDVCGHVNGGPTSLDDEGVRRLVTDSDMVLQLVQAGNLRSALEIVRLARDRGELHRVILGSDTPTGTGVMPLGVLKTVCELSSLAGLPPEEAWALATGTTARVYRLRAGVVAEGREADLVVMDAPWGSVAADARGAIARGDVPGISAVIIDGVVRTLRSRNTPMAARMATVAPPMPWLGGGH
ncbi:MAG TPA: amidohydrolase family protein [Thermodesulfobacteriota bacterium]|nr:amidohydrolase family protein [Thermodesulfobacteriota bacterium]